MKLTFSSVSKFKDEILERLRNKALIAIEAKRSDILEQEECLTDLCKKVHEIAAKHSVTIEFDEKEGTIEIAEDNDEDAVNAFLQEINKSGLDVTIEDENDAEDKLDGEDEIEEAALLKKTDPAEKRKNKKNFKKNKAKLKIKAKKFRKSAAGKKLAKKSKLMAKKGKTSTGKKITRRK